MNKVENNDVLKDEITPEEFEKISVELMRYRKNSLSYTFGILALLFSILAGFIGLNSLKYDFTTLIKILVNIAVLLFGFLYSEKTKSYSKSGSIGLFILGIVCGLRTFWAPLILLTGIESRYGKIIGSDYKGVENGHSLNISWLPDSAKLRGVLTLIFLILAAACFIYAAIVGMAKTRKLQKYMDSLKEVH